MLVVGLTGGIGSGKSAVAAIFEELGARVIDADRISREVMVPHADCWQKVVEHFGRGVLEPDLAIDRRKLALEIFADPEKRTLLNSIVHPFITKRIDEMLGDISRRDPSALVIIDAALLVETGLYKCYDKLVVVAADEKTQLSRLAIRDKLSRDEALKRVRAQLPLTDKKRVAHYVIDNGGSRAETRRQTEQLFQVLRAACPAVPERGG